MGWLTARVRSFGFAFAGLAHLLKTQGNAQLHLAATLAVAGLGLWLHISRYDWLWLVAAMALVWITEALNTALEEVCDAVSRAHHPGIGRAKDVAAAAVLLAALAAAVIGAAVFLPYLGLR